MRSYLLLGLLSLAVINITSAQQVKTAPKGQLIDGVAIVVGEEIITHRQFNTALEQAKREIQRVPPQQRPNLSQLENEVAKGLIFEKLHQKIAQRLNVTIADSAVDKAINDIANRNKATVAQLKEYLRSQNISFTTYREDIRKQMMAARVRDEVVRTVRVTEDALDLYMQSAEFKKAMTEMQSKKMPQVRVSHILVKVSKDRPSEEALSKIQRLRARIESGEPFENIARAQSDDPVAAANGGSLGWVGEGQLAPEFERAMFSLPLNQLSQPVQSPFGYHLIMVHESRDGGVVEENLRNIAREMLFRKQAIQLWQQWQDELFNNTYIEKRL